MGPAERALLKVLIEQGRTFQPAFDYREAQKRGASAEELARFAPDQVGIKGFSGRPVTLAQMHEADASGADLGKLGAPTPEELAGFTPDQPPNAGAAAPTGTLGGSGRARPRAVGEGTPAGAGPSEGGPFPKRRASAFASFGDGIPPRGPVPKRLGQADFAGRSSDGGTLGRARPRVTDSGAAVEGGAAPLGSARARRPRQGTLGGFGGVRPRQGTLGRLRRQRNPLLAGGR